MGFCSKLEYLFAAFFFKDDFTERFSGLSGKVQWLATNKIGIVAIPKFVTETAESKHLSAGAKKMVNTILLHYYDLCFCNTVNFRFVD